MSECLSEMTQTDYLALLVIEWTLPGYYHQHMFSFEIFSSFAYKTVKERLPVILAKVADTVFRAKTDVKEKYGEVMCRKWDLSKTQNVLQCPIQFYIW